MNSKDIYFQIMYEMIQTGQFQVLYSQQKRNYGTRENYYENEVHILAAIVEDNSINLAELAKRFFKTKSYISQIISKLENMKLIRKSKSKEDNRKTVYHITAKGMRLYECHNNYDYEQSRRLLHYFDGFKTEELEAFLKILKKYHLFQLENPTIKM